MTITRMICSMLVGITPLANAGDRPTAAPYPMEDLILFRLNDLEFGLDKQTGGIIHMAYPVAGTMLQATPRQESMVDVAYPVEEFHALRLASRFSSEAQITKGDDGVTVRWEKLGASRNLRFPGAVACTVTMRAAEDGRSVVMNCAIDNQSPKPVRQVLFPDFGGLIPFAGDDKTYMRTTGSRRAAPLNPFQELRSKPHTAGFYAQDPGFAGQEYMAGGAYSQMWTRWLDFGGIAGGFSLFPKKWGWDPPTKIYLRRSEIDGKVRLSYVHDVSVAPGSEWESGEFWLTPHKHGWAEGIEPYRKYVNEHVKRDYPLPRHVREGLGYRTVFLMNGGTPNTEEDIVYRLTDLPEVAREAKKYGLDELVPWFWTDSFQLPITTLPILGSDEDFVNAIKACKKLGVNVSPFISVFVLSDPTAGRFGLHPQKGSGWTYHVNFIPMFNPPYSFAQSATSIDPSNKAWRREVLSSWKQFIDWGVPSLVWDVYKGTRKEPNIYSLTSEIRALAKQRDPESVFAGESLTSLEIESRYLDYTWNWMDYRDFRPFTSVFPAPRVAVNVDKSPLVVKKCFTDNIYMNVMPRKPGGINGSAMIEDCPALSMALRQCAKLRQQFLPYFMRGKLIGECILSEESPGIHISAYVLPDRLLAILLNLDETKRVALNGELDPWLASTSRNYDVKVYNTEGILVGKYVTDSHWREETKELKPLEMLLYEFQPKP